MGKDKDLAPVQGKRRISRLTKIKPTQEKGYLRMVKKMSKNAADNGLTSRNQTLELVKLMTRIEDSSSKFKMLKILANTNHGDYLKLFLDNHGLKILYLWMVRCKEADFYLKIAILKILANLPVSSKTTLKAAKVWDLVEKWSKTTKKNGQDNLIDNSYEKGDKDYRLSNKILVSNRYSKERSDLTEIVELEERCHQPKTSQTKKQNKISNISAKEIKSITLDSDSDEKNESQVQTKCYDQSGKISDDFVQDIIMQMSIILRERKLSSSLQSKIHLQSSNINFDKKSFIEPSGISSTSTDALSDCQKPSNSLRNKTTDSLSKSKDKVQNGANNRSSSKPKDWTAADVNILAKKLFEKWKDLKEVFKIPKIPANKSVDIDQNKKKTEVTSSSKAEKTGDSSKSSATNGSSKTTNNTDKSIKDKRNNNQGNKAANQQKSANKPQDVPRKSNHKKHRSGRQRFDRFNRFNRFERSCPPLEFRYQFGPQDYLGLCQPESLNYEYYPSYCYLNQLPWQMAPLNNYR